RSSVAAQPRAGAMREEERRLLRSAGDLAARAHQIDVDRRPRAAGERHVAILASLAIPDEQSSRGEVDVEDVEAGALAGADSRAVQRLEDRAVPKADDAAEVGG